MKPIVMPVIIALRKLGQDINDARRRRRITVALLAERAGILIKTVSKIEKGEPTVSMGAYASVLFVLGLTDRLRDLADVNYDPIGRMLDEEHLPKRVRLPGSKRAKKDLEKAKKFI